MSKNDNPLVRFIRLTLILGGALFLSKAALALFHPLPDWRYMILLGLAMVLSWPRLKLPVNTAEILFFLVLLVYGSPAAIVLAAMVTVVAARNLLKTDKQTFFVRLGQTIVSATIAGFVLHWLLASPTTQALPATSVSLINALAWIAWIRFLFHANWSLVFATIRTGNIWEQFTQGQWVNSFIAYFAAAVAAGIVWLIVKQQPPYIEVLSLLVITIFYFAYWHFKEKYIYDAEEISKLHLRTIEALASAIEAKDHRATKHTQRIQTLTECLGKAMELTEPELKGLRAAAVLRDIGKLAVPDYILHKSDELTAAEIEKVKLHPVIGASILERVAFPYPLVPAVKHHHEHWDGTGYPDQLKGEAIPITARILAVVEAFDEAYEGGSSKFAKDEAIKLLLQESGHKYDPEIVRIFLQNLSTFEAQTAYLYKEELRLTSSPSSALPIASEELALEPTPYLKEIRQAHLEGTELLYLAQTLSSTLNLEEAVAIIVSRIGRLIMFDTGAIYLCDETGLTAYVAGAVGMYAEKLRQHEVFVGQGIVGRALASGQAISTANPAFEFHELESAVQQAFQSMTVYPLTKAGRIIGAISLLSAEPNSFTSEHQRVIAMVEPLAADALFNSMTYLRTEARALTDALTGLPNSRALITYFDQESNRAERYNTTLAMLMVDLDGFKQVNDTFGHQAGDTVLREIALCLKQELRAGDPLIRYAGDEFIVLLPYAEESSINDLIARIQKYLEAYSILINGLEVHIGASIGYAIYGRDGLTLDELMRVADEGMYRNKALRKRQIRPRMIHTPAPSTPDDISLSLKEAVAS